LIDSIAPRLYFATGLIMDISLGGKRCRSRDRFGGEERLGAYIDRNRHFHCGLIV
jgi:hypothetical protein